MNTFSSELKKEYEQRKLKNPQYSIRAFAKYLGIQPSATSEFIKGERKASSKMIKRLAERLNWSLAKQENCSSEQVSTTLDHAVFDVIGGWHYFAILSLLELEDAKCTAKYISQKLGLTLDKSNEAIRKLKELGFINIDGNLSSGATLKTTDDIKNLAIQKNHMQGIELAREQLLNCDVEYREYSGTTVAMDPDQLDEVKKEMRKFRHRIESICNSGAKRAVYRLNMQMFPLTNIEKPGENK